MPKRREPLGEGSSDHHRMLDRIEVRRSPIHGRGIFARKRLRRGQRIGRFEGVETGRDGEHVLWLIDDDGNEWGVEGRNELRFLNHGVPPNAEFRDLELFVLRNVQPGAELLIDYGEEWHGEEWHGEE